MSLIIRLPETIRGTLDREFRLDETPDDVGALLALLDARSPGLRAELDSASVNAAVNGEVVLHRRDQTPLKDGDEVEFLVMFAGG